MKPENGLVVQGGHAFGIEIESRWRPNGNEWHVLIPERIKINDWGVDAMRTQFAKNKGYDLHIAVLGSYVNRGIWMAELGRIVFCKMIVQSLAAEPCNPNFPMIVGPKMLPEPITIRLCDGTHRSQKL